MGKSFKSNVIIILLDLLIALFAFWGSRYIGDLPHWCWMALTAVIWVGIGIITKKLYFNEYKSYKVAFVGMVVIDSVSAIILFLLYRNFVPGYENDYSIPIAASIIFVLESILCYVLTLFVYRKMPFFYEGPLLVENSHKSMVADEELVDDSNDLHKLLECFEQDKIDGDPSGCGFSRRTVITNSSNPEKVLQSKSKSPSLVIHDLSLNNVRHINTLLAFTNYALAKEGYVVCNCETSDTRRSAIFNRSPHFIAKIFNSFDFFTHRVFPKLPVTKHIYYWITKGKRRALTRVETLGRFYRAGFDVTHEYTINNRFFIIAQKIKEPIRDDKPSNGMLIRLRRNGKNGKLIGVYKFRTMHAYSEYLQPYMYKTEGLTKDGGRYGNDYRISKSGAFMRKVFIDELPMLINWLKGDLKLVGVRPLSNHYFSLYTKEFQELRLKVKPGLIPPFYLDRPKSIEEKQESERRYIEAYIKSPLITDWCYFWRIFYSIVFKGARSE